jgi:Protein of unknown function (DUF1573)
MKTHYRIFTVTLSMLFAAGAHASLQWEQTAIELRPAINDKQAIGHFKYQNTGKSPLHFKQVHASCGCTTAQTQKDVVPPGEKGEITATFNIGDRTGTQVKTITVQTDDPDVVKATTQLKLTAIIPQPLEVNPAFLMWQDKEEPKPKTVTVKVAKDFAVKDLKVTPSSQDFQTTVSKTGKDEFKIEVKPKDTARMLAGTLTIQPDDTPKLSYVNMRVMGPNVPMKNSTLPATVQPAPGSVLAPPTPVANPAAHSAPVPAPSSTPSSNP